MKGTPLRAEGYQLLHEGAIALSQVEANGIRIDVPLLNKTKEKLTSDIRGLRKELQSDNIWRMWQKRYGGKANLTSRPQLAEMLHVQLDYEVEEMTETGRPSMDEETLQKFDNPFVDKLVRLQRYEKALGTFLKGIEKEVVDDRLHPVFNLHTVQTYRSSSDSPNFQNQPVRDKEIAKLIRQHFIASPDSVLVENDFKGIEVGVSACYHHDKNFISYIKTPGKDMHGDMAAQIYFLDPAWIKKSGKDHRYGAKNKFVFPQFYGDYYVSCAKSLWEWCTKGKLLGPEGQPLLQHLKSKGIHKLGACDPDERPEQGTFERHIQEVENDFWNNRFRGYGQWRKDWYNDYLRKGYFDLLTGFRVQGDFRRNQVTNYPVQGSAFHCLLWTLIRVNKLLRKYKMRSKVVGQIHDSLIGDVLEKELRNYLELVEKTVTVDLRKAYEWLCVPLEIEYEIAPRLGSWYEKREVKFKNGRFLHPKDPSKSTADVDKFLQSIRK